MIDNRKHVVGSPVGKHCIEANLISAGRFRSVVDGSPKKVAPLARMTDGISRNIINVFALGEVAMRRGLNYLNVRKKSFIAIKSVRSKYTDLLCLPNLQRQFRSKRLIVREGGAYQARQQQYLY